MPLLWRVPWGPGRRDDAKALALHAVVIACLMGALFTTVAIWGGPALYRAMGGIVGTNIGAGRMVRARRVSWVGAGLAAAMTGGVGLLGACFPRLWLGLFSTTPEVLTAGTTYLTIVGPTYGFFGLGLALYFAFQGAGQLLWPLLAVAARLVTAAGGGWLAIHWFGGGLPALFTVIAVALVVYGTIVAGAVKAGAWRETTPRRQTRLRPALHRWGMQSAHLVCINSKSSNHLRGSFSHRSRNTQLGSRRDRPSPALPDGRPRLQPKSTLVRR